MTLQLILATILMLGIGVAFWDNGGQLLWRAAMRRGWLGWLFPSMPMVLALFLALGYLLEGTLTTTYILASLVGSLIFVWFVDMVVSLSNRKTSELPNPILEPDGAPALSAPTLELEQKRQEVTKRTTATQRQKSIEEVFVFLAVIAKMYNEKPTKNFLLLQDLFCFHPRASGLTLQREAISNTLEDPLSVTEEKHYENEVGAVKSKPAMTKKFDKRKSKETGTKASSSHVQFRHKSYLHSYPTTSRRIYDSASGTNPHRHRGTEPYRHRKTDRDGGADPHARANGVSRARVPGVPGQSGRDRNGGRRGSS